MPFPDSRTAAKRWFGLFNYLVRLSKQRRENSETMRVASLGIDCELRGGSSVKRLQKLADRPTVREDVEQESRVERERPD